MTKAEIVPTLARVEASILEIRGHRVILDADIAALYDVPTRALLQAVKRNLARFPGDFMFQLTRDEALASRSQSVTLNARATTGRGGNLKYLPHAFTEHGVAMLSSVLRSERAIQVNIEIMRSFVRLRQAIAADGTLARRIDALEHRYDSQFRQVFDAIRLLMTEQVKVKAKLTRGPAKAPQRRIGFRPSSGRTK